MNNISAHDDQSISKTNNKTSDNPSDAKKDSAGANVDPDDHPDSNTNNKTSDNPSDPKKDSAQPGTDANVDSAQSYPRLIGAQFHL